MADEAFTVKFTEPERAKLARLINQLAADSELATIDAVVGAARYGAFSFSASTRKAKRTKGIRKTKKGMSRHFPPSRYPLYIVGYGRKGEEHPIFVTTSDRAEAKAMPEAQIRYRGLAKAVWNVATRNLGGRATRAASGRAVRTSRRLSRVTKTLQRHNPSVTIQSNVRYAADAFKQRGNYTLVTVGARTLKYFEKGIENGTAKRFAKTMAGAA